MVEWRVFGPSETLVGTYLGLNYGFWCFSLGSQSCTVTPTAGMLCAETQQGLGTLPAGAGVRAASRANADVGAHGVCPGVTPPLQALVLNRTLLTLGCSAPVSAFQRLGGL